MKDLRVFLLIFLVCLFYSKYFKVLLTHTHTGFKGSLCNAKASPDTGCCTFSVLSSINARLSGQPCELLQPGEREPRGGVNVSPFGGHLDTP